MVMGALVISSRRAVIENSKVGSCFQPQVIGQARLKFWGSVVLIGIGGHRQQRSVDIRGRRIATNICPILIFHDDYENGLDRRKPGFAEWGIASDSRILK